MIPAVACPASSDGRTTAARADRRSFTIAMAQGIRVSLDEINPLQRFTVWILPLLCAYGTPRRRLSTARGAGQSPLASLPACPIALFCRGLPADSVDGCPVGMATVSDHAAGGNRWTRAKLLRATRDIAGSRVVVFLEKPVCPRRPPPLSNRARWHCPPVLAIRPDHRSRH